MIFKKCFFVIVVTFAFNSCTVFKKSELAVNKFPVINLDTLETAAKSMEPEQYRASLTRLNDIIHTKLDVRFDWAKQYLFGKATITIKPYFYPTSSLELDARGLEIKEVSLMQTENVMIPARAPSNGKIYEPFESKTIVKKPLEYTYEDDIIKIKLDKE